MVVVRDGDDDIAFLSLTDPEFDLSDRGVEGREAAPPVDVFLTTDRGAYRAGETVYATALARDADSDGGRGPAADGDSEAPRRRGIFRASWSTTAARAGMSLRCPSPGLPRAASGGWRSLPILRPRRWPRRPSWSRISCPNASTLT